MIKKGRKVNTEAFLQQNHEMAEKDMHTLSPKNGNMVSMLLYIKIVYFNE